MVQAPILSNFPHGEKKLPSPSTRGVEQARLGHTKVTNDMEMAHSSKKLKNFQSENVWDMAPNILKGTLKQGVSCERSRLESQTDGETVLKRIQKVRCRICINWTQLNCMNFYEFVCNKKRTSLLLILLILMILLIQWWWWYINSTSQGPLKSWHLEKNVRQKRTRADFLGLGDVELKKESWIAWVTYNIWYIWHI